MCDLCKPNRWAKEDEVFNKIAKSSELGDYEGCLAVDMHLVVYDGHSEIQASLIDVAGNEIIRCSANVQYCPQCGRKLVYDEI